jgi:hypothetical protein
VCRYQPNTYNHIYTMANKSTTTKQVEKPKPAPLPKSFSKAQATKAVDALYAYHAKASKEKEETELLPQEEYVWLVLNLKRGTTRRKLMPVRMYVPVVSFAVDTVTDIQPTTSPCPSPTSCHFRLSNHKRPSARVQGSSRVARGQCQIHQPSRWSRQAQGKVQAI